MCLQMYMTCMVITLTFTLTCGMMRFGACRPFQTKLVLAARQLVRSNPSLDGSVQRYSREDMFESYCLGGLFPLGSCMRVKLMHVPEALVEVHICLVPSAERNSPSCSAERHPIAAVWTSHRESYNGLASPMARKAEAQQGQEQLQSTQTSVRWHHSHIRHGLHGKIKPRAKPQNTHQHSSPPRTANAPDMHYTDPAGSLSECSQWTRACARRRRVALHYCTDTTRTSLGGTQHLPPGGPAIKRSWCSTTDTRPASLGGRGGRG